MKVISAFVVTMLLAAGSALAQAARSGAGHAGVVRGTAYSMPGHVAFRPSGWSGYYYGRPYGHYAYYGRSYYYGYPHYYSYPYYYAGYTFYSYPYYRYPYYAYVRYPYVYGH